MTKRSLVLLAVALLAIGGCSKKGAPAAAPAGTHVAAVPPPAGKQWTDVVRATPEGGMLMGNPDAPVKLVEYASFTCPHCMHFEETGAEPLKAKYISTGKVSWEFRSFLIHGPDAPLTLLMNCRGPAPYFALAEQLYAAQDEFMKKIVAMPPAQQQAVVAMPPVQQFKTLMDVGGLYGFFAARGLPRAQADACLSDQKAIDTMTAQQTKIQQDGINQTPTFVINGQQQQAATWEQLDPLLAQAVG
jgi:protein-disulfide isomerase